MDKLKLLKDICDWYNYTLTLEHGVIKMSNIPEDPEIRELYAGQQLDYTTVDDALKDWLSTLEDTNISIYETGDVDDLYNTWSKKEIDFIKNLCGINTTELDEGRLNWKIN